jgi:hypothetical protein
MIIKKDWYLRLTNKRTNKICKVLIRVIDDSRKVNIETTGSLICEIKDWIKVYSKKIPSDTQEQQHFQNQEYAKKYLNKWEYWLYFLIPENRATTEDELSNDYTKQQIVQLNYKLLDSNKLLTYNQALFLLLGLNAVELGNNITNFPSLDGEMPRITRNPIEYYFWSTKQNQELKTSAYVQNGKITSEDLEKLANEYNFFIQKDNRIIKRHLDEKISKKIYDVLTDHYFITGDYDNMWIWNKSTGRNKLSYFAKRLKQERILGNNCHIELSNYILDPSPDTKKPLRNLADISTNSQNLINDIVNKIKNIIEK